MRKQRFEESKTGITKLEGRDKIQLLVIANKLNEIIEYLEKNYVEWSDGEKDDEKRR